MKGLLRDSPLQHADKQENSSLDLLRFDKGLEMHTALIVIVPIRFIEL